MKAIKNKVIVKMDTTEKEKYNLGNGTILEIPRGHNFNLREDRSTMGYVIDGEGLPSGAMVLCHHLSTEPTYLVSNDTVLTDQERSEGYKVFSLPKDMVNCYFENGEWKPCESFVISQRIFKPYKGKIAGIEHQQVKNRMYVVKGEHEGNVVVTTENCDVELIFHNQQHREERLIRTRDREIMAVDNGMTNELKKGKLLIGVSPTTAQKINHA